MGYRITYDLVPPGTNRRDRKWTNFATYIVIAVILISAFAVRYVALPWIRDVLITGDPEVTAGALDSLLADLRAGVSLTDAVAAFCQVIIENGNPG